MLKILPITLHFSALSAVFAVCASTNARLPLPAGPARGAGLLLMIAGVGLSAWAVAHLRLHVLGLAEPRRPSLLTSGPYGLVRHPIYLGFAVAMLGVVLWYTSLMGLATYLLVFIPSEIYRARGEERALARKFGDQWTEYTRRTGILFPKTGLRGFS